MVKNLPVIQEIQVWSLERSLEKGVVTHSSIPALRIPQTEEPSRLQSTGSHTVGHNRVTDTLTFTLYSELIQFMENGSDGLMILLRHY